MENFEQSNDMYVTPQRPPYSENLQTPPWNDQRCFHEKVDVRKKTGARKKLVTIFQNPMFGQGGSGQAPYRPWKEAPQAEKSKEEARKISQISPYMRNKLSGKFHSMKQSSPKVMNNLFFYKILIIFLAVLFNWRHGKYSSW